LNQEWPTGLDPSHDLTEVRELVADEINIPAESLTILLRGQELDVALPVAKLGIEDGARLQIRSHHGQPVDRSSRRENRYTSLMIRIVKSLGGAPQIEEFTLPANATLAEIQPEVKARWGLGSIETEFSLVDPVTGSNTRISNTMGLNEIDHQRYVLVLRRGGSANEFMVEDNTEMEVEQLTELHATCPRRLFPNTDNDFQIVFRAPQRGDNCSVKIGFSTTDRVKNARVKVAKFLSVPTDAVALEFGPKPLQDPFVLSRLRIGDLPIVVNIKEVAEILFLLARQPKEEAPD
jgi:hypothetical protein